MHIGVKLSRHIEIDNVCDAVNIESAASNIRGDEDADSAAAEAFKRLLTLTLRAVAVDISALNATLIV
jgi:hypothetical protein